jgi:hypothetical protein
MSVRIRVVGVGLACLACCLPLLFAIAGITTGTVGAVGYWFGRTEALVAAGLALAYLLIVISRQLRATRSGKELLPQPTRKPPAS